MCTVNDPYLYECISMHFIARTIHQKLSLLNGWNIPHNTVNTEQTVSAKPTYTLLDLNTYSETSQIALPEGIMPSKNNARC